MSGYRQQIATQMNYGTDFASPTDSEFSVANDESDYVRHWDTQRVADWLRSVGAGEYVELFRQHHINGAALLDLTSASLKEMGIRKVGDRVRLGAQAKKFRYAEHERKRESGIVHIAKDNPIMTPPSAGSPRQAIRTTPKAEKSQYAALRGSSRPSSPLHIIDEERSVLGRVSAFSPREIAAREQTSTYFHPQASRSEAHIARTANYIKAKSSLNDLGVRTATYAHRKANSLVVDTDIANGIPKDKPWIRAIFDNARSSIVSVEGCQSAEDIVLKTLKKGGLNEQHFRSYCFWVLDGIEADPTFCRRLPDSELFKICTDGNRKERERLVFRKIHAGEPEGSQLESAAAWAIQQSHQAPTSAAHTPSRSRTKLERLTGESLPPLSYPMSPASKAERERHLQETAKGLESDAPIIRPRARKAQELHGARPDSEFVVADPKQFFPDVDEEKIEHLRRMSIRRSQRLSRATSRLSVASNLSFTSSVEDAPPVPRIPDSAWLAQRRLPARAARPLSVYNGALDPLDEVDSPIEPDRKSYISFAASDNSTEEEPASATSTENDADAPNVNITDPTGATITSHTKGRLFSSASASSLPSSQHSNDATSLHEQLTQVIAEDGEDPDPELTTFLQPDSWENIPYMRGKLIGQGSFGSVYLALHATTAELMAVKQVELPSTNTSSAGSSGTTSALDQKKNTMVEALKREIGLLRELKHKHIVQYLGSSSSSDTLNIFLEYVPGGSIAKMLVDYGSLNELVVSKYVRQTLVGLAFLHSKDIIHRDIKGANILIDTKGVVKISDFGISKRVQDSKTLLSSASASDLGAGGGVAGGAGRRRAGLAANRVSLQGSVFWMAPEVVKQTSYTRKADLWSLGCLIVEMLTGSHPHPDLSQLQAIFKIGGKGADPSPRVPEGASREVKEFLEMTFRVDELQRPEARMLLEEPFLAKK